MYLLKGWENPVSDEADESACRSSKQSIKNTADILNVFIKDFIFPKSGFETEVP